MDRRTILKGFAGGLAAPALSLTALGQAISTPQQARHAAFADALRDKPWLKGFIGAQVRETKTTMQTVHGAIPHGLSGSLYRNGPAYHDLGGERFGHWFDAPGMIQKFTIEGQVISHHGRLIETARNRRELNENRMIFQGFGTSRSDLSSGGSADGQNVGNIHVLQHAGELMATWEGGSPHVIDPHTLETKGTKAWSAETAGLPFSAHTQHDHDGSLWSIGYSLFPAALVLYHIGLAGDLQQVKVMPLDFAPMIHDFIVTDTRLVILIPPLLADQTGAELSILGRYSWHNDLPVRALIFDKNDLSLIREMELDPFWVFHFGNGYDSGSNEITLDLTLHDTPNFMLNDAYAMMDGSWDGHSSAALTYGQIRLDVLSGQSKMEIFPSLGTAEFLRIDPRASLGNHEHTLMLAERSGSPGFGTLTLYDRRRDTQTSYSVADTEVMEEHLIVPKSNVENDFWILGTSQDWLADMTFFSIYDGVSLPAGPIFRAQMSGILPLGLHGIFI